MGFENNKSLKPTPRQSCQFIRIYFLEKKTKHTLSMAMPRLKKNTWTWIPLILERVKYSIIKSKTSTPTPWEPSKKTQSAQPHPFPTNQIKWISPTPHKENRKIPRFPNKFCTNQPPPPWDITLSWIWFNAPRGGTPPQEKLSWGGKSGSLKKHRNSWVAWKII